MVTFGYTFRLYFGFGHYLLLVKNAALYLYSLSHHKWVRKLKEFVPRPEALMVGTYF